MDIILASHPAGGRASALAVFSFTSAGKALLADHGLASRLKAALADKIVKGETDELASFREIDWNGHRHVIVAGLGARDAVSPESFRRAGGKIVAEAKKLRISSLSIEAAPAIPKGAERECIRGLVEGLVLGGYSFTELKSKPEPEAPLKVVLVVKDPASRELRRTLSEAQTGAECVKVSRRFGDLPSNFLTPAIFAAEMSRLGRQAGLGVEVWDKARLKRERMGGILAVSQGSAHDARFVILRHRGGKPGQPPLVFVGKGVTFDSGGISIKAALNMDHMKFDMCGAANVAGALLAVARLKLPVNVVGLLALTENMPSGTATKPGDVVRARNGKTYEVNNTDAEGRMILSDALCYASELKPRAVVDLATLTGAMVVAVGNVFVGTFYRDPNLQERIEKAAAAAGEKVWPMPLDNEYLKDMKGSFADLSNISAGRDAGACTAAAFLSEFVAPGVPWAHCDIAGAAWATGKRLPYNTEKGASGVLVRTLVELARQS